MEYSLTIVVAMIYCGAIGVSKALNFSLIDE